MTDLEISKALALAIGWREEQTFHYEYNFPDRLYVRVRPMAHRIFDYLDWNIIGPIAQKYDLVVDFGKNYVHCNHRSLGVGADTPQKAIALAVIGGVK